MANLKDRYANALFELSIERATLEKDLEQSVLVRDILEGAGVQEFLQNPHIPDSEKYHIFHSFPGLSIHLMNFLNLMVQKNRESLIVPVLTEYINRINRRLGRIEAKVVSAKALTDKQIESIQDILSRQINMQVEINAKVDPDVIAGFYVLVEGRIIDGTIRAKLNNMRERLKRGS